MATKKSSKKSGGTKTSGAKKTSVKSARKKGRNEDRPPLPPLPGNPPVILGGGGSIVIYSDQELVRPNAGEVPALTGYPFVLIYPDRTKHPVHVDHLRNGRPVHGHRHGLIRATDHVVIDDV